MENNLNKTTCKYIVFETTNLVNNKIYIGIHKVYNVNVFDGYLGCGIYTKLPYTYEHAKTLLQSDVKHYGIKNFRRNILSICNTEDEALKIEEAIVNESFLKRSDVYNQLLGGKRFKDNINIYLYMKFGEYKKEFHSLRSASVYLDLPKSVIYKAAKLGVCIKDKYYFSFVKADSFDIAKTEYVKNRMVYQYDQNGNFIREYNTQTEASKDNKYSNISKSIRLKSIDKNNFIWSLEKLDVYNHINNEKCYKVGKFNLKGKLIHTYKSQTEAIKTEGIDIQNVLCGLEESYNNYIFRYIS